VTAHSPRTAAWLASKHAKPRGCLPYVAAIAVVAAAACNPPPLDEVAVSGEVGRPEPERVRVAAVDGPQVFATTTTVPTTTHTHPPTTTTTAPAVVPATTTPAVVYTPSSGRLGDPYHIETWYVLRECEAPDWAGGWAANTGNGYYGGLQFALASWRAVGGTGYPHEHSPEEQIRRGQMLWERQGWGAWPSCSSKLGWR
jgi:hypothetical protein